MSIVEQRAIHELNMRRSGVRPVIVIAHAAFDPRRVEAMARLRAELEPQCKDAGIALYVYEDHAAKGSLGPWLECLRIGLAHRDATHVTFLSDDSILVPHFVEVLRNAIASQQDQILCFQSNHERAKDVPEGWRWYTTHDGFTAFAGTMTRALVAEHLEWRERTLRDDVVVQGDEGVNLWAMATGRLIYKSLPSLVDHDLSLPSCDGNDHHAELSPRRPTVWRGDEDLRGLTWSGLGGYSQRPIATHLGRTYQGNHWRLAFDVKSQSPEMLDRMYLAQRNGQLVSPRPHVLIATPCYTSPMVPFLRSVEAVKADLANRDIAHTVLMTGGDSLVTRARHTLMHQFLCSTATHLLQWDSDVECLAPDTVSAMLDSGHDVVGGAYPFRDGSGNVVMNMRAEDREAGRACIDSHGCAPVDDIGTGFLLTSRKALLDMMCRHPELLYESDMPDTFGAPMWALFDTGLERKANGRMRYASEDWRFCTLAREAGYTVHVQAFAQFAHWGLTGHRGALQVHQGAPA